MFGVQPYLTDFVDMDEFTAPAMAASLPYEFIVIHPRLRQTFVEVRTLADMMEPYFPDQGDLRLTADRALVNEFASRRCAIEYQLLTLAQANAGSEDENRAATECCRLASQIFVNLVFRKVSPGWMVHSRLATRLRAAIIEFDRDHASQHAATLLLWTSVMGYLALRAGTMQLWFAGWVAHCVNELDVVAPEDLTYQLCKIAWSHCALREPLQEMWAHLQQLQSMGVELRITEEGEGQHQQRRASERSR